MLTTVLPAVRAAGLEPDGNIYESTVPVRANGQIDKLVFGELAKSGAKPIVCSDAVFVRRAYLDVIGTLPTADEARQFILSTSANKRSALIDQLLTRPEFADYMAMKWGDALRIKAEFPINLWPNAAQAYHRWVRASIVDNKHYDQFTRELLTSSGSNFRVGPVNFYRAVQNRTPEGLAGVVALTFMGVRVETWPTNQMADLAAFFSEVGYKQTAEWKEEHVFWDPLSTSKVPGNSAPGYAAISTILERSNNVALLKIVASTNPPPSSFTFPDGSTMLRSKDKDPREVFANWLIQPKNPWFARNAANRAWNWFVGNSLLDTCEDGRANAQAANTILLAFLEKEFIKSRYDLKQLYRLILKSTTYQLSSMPRSGSGESTTHSFIYPLRRLDAEVLIDAINKITGASDLYTSPIPEPFTYIPDDMTAVAIADGSITSPFLALFGRSARATGVDDERNNRPVPAQWLHLLNSSHIQRKLEQGQKLKGLIESGKSQSEIFEELYLAILTRYPTTTEIKNFETYGGIYKDGKPTGAKRREDWLDLTWALINSSEFLYRH